MGPVRQTVDRVNRGFNLWGQTADRLTRDWTAFPSMQQVSDGQAWSRAGAKHWGPDSQMFHGLNQTNYQLQLVLPRPQVSYSPASQHALQLTTGSRRATLRGNTSAAAGNRRRQKKCSLMLISGHKTRRVRALRSDQTRSKRDVNRRKCFTDMDLKQNQLF